MPSRLLLCGPFPVVDRHKFSKEVVIRGRNVYNVRHGMCACRFLPKDEEPCSRRSRLLSA